MEKQKNKRRPGMARWIIFGIAAGLIVALALILVLLAGRRVLPTPGETASDFTAQSVDFTFYLAPDGLALVRLRGTEANLYTLSDELNIIGNYLLVTQEPIQDVAFSPGGDAVALMTGDIITTYDLETRLITGQYAAEKIAFAYGSREIALIAGSELVIVSMSDRRVVDTLPGVQVQAMRYSPNGGWLALTTYQPEGAVVEARVYDTRTWEAQVYGDVGTGIEVAFHPEDTWLALAGGDVTVLELMGSTRTEYPLEGARRVSFSANGDWLAALSSNGVMAFRWNTSEIIPPNPAYYEPISLPDAVVQDMAFVSPQRLITINSRAVLTLWDVVDGTQIQQITLPD